MRGSSNHTQLVVNVNTRGWSHNRERAVLGEDAEQTLECHQGRQRFPRTFLPLHFPMLGAPALTQRHYQQDRVIGKLLMTYRERSPRIQTHV